MRRYRYSYHTIVSYDHMVAHHQFQLRMTPRIESHQRLLSHVVDHLARTTLLESVDCFGNQIYYGSMEHPHDLFVAASHGVVECDAYRVEEPRPTMLYLAPSLMTRLSDGLVHFASGIDVGEGSALERACRVCEATFNTMRYESGATTTETTAAESFEMKAGVCQDFAHIVIAICRKMSIFARYCVGFLVGTGETHAWVEVYDQEDGAWYGVDPTHNRMAEYDYIKIAHGRDASDCSVIRGVHRGGAGHQTQVRVLVEPLI